MRVGLGRWIKAFHWPDESQEEEKAPSKGYTISTVCSFIGKNLKIFGAGGGPHVFVMEKKRV
jgi:hypothetical protein